MSKLIDRLINKCLEKTNFLFGPIRRIFINNTHFTIISNNCWGGKVYRYFKLPYMSPTVGLYFYADDYLRFCSNFSYYINKRLEFINVTESAHSDDLIRKGESYVIIGKLDDVEIIFLHYGSEKEARVKWERRTRRINYDNLYFKFSEQNGCTIEHLKLFSRLNISNKLILTTKDYGLRHQVILRNSVDSNETIDETLRFKYVSPIKYINKLY